MSRTPDISFRPYIGLNGVYDTSYRGVVVSNKGQLQSIDALGVQAAAGIYGSHRFKHSVIGLDYHGDYNHFPHNPYADSIDQMLTLEYDRQLTRRTSFTLTDAVGTYTRNYIYSSASGLIDPAALILPGNDLFDNRVVYGQTTGSLTYRASSRMSVSFSGSGYLVRRRSTSLYGVTGYTAEADAAYRLTRFVTLSSYYDFQHFEFTRAFGASDIHTAGISIAARLTRTVEFALEGGGSRVETLFLATVPIDPAIAAITGQSTGIQAAYRVQYVPTGRARLTKQMQHTRAEVSYLRGITPGNGVYLTSRMESLTAVLSYSGQRHWSFSANAGYNKLNAVAQNIGTYKGYNVGLGISRDLARGLQLALRGDAVRNATNFTRLNRDFARITMGFYWSPGDIPLNLW